MLFGYDVIIKSINQQLQLPPPTITQICVLRGAHVKRGDGKERLQWPSTHSHGDAMGSVFGPRFGFYGHGAFHSEIFRSGNCLQGESRLTTYLYFFCSKPICFNKNAYKKLKCCLKLYFKINIESYLAV